MLGTPSTLVPSEFGEEIVGDLAFKFSTEGGDVLAGTVQYDGLPNNLLLVIDPVTGQAELRNTSPFDVSIDGYEIRSPDGSLLPSDGNWQSLADNESFSGWAEIGAATATQLAELKADGSTELTSGTVIELGQLFDGSGLQDIELDFSIFNGAIMAGAVTYDLLPTRLAGDFDSSGEVAAGDLNLVLFNWNSTGESLPAEWVNERPVGTVGIDQLNAVLFNWGRASQPASVPEPACVLMVLHLLVPALILRRGNRGCSS